LNHIALINRHPQRVIAHLDALVAAGAALGKAAIAARAGWDWRLIDGYLCGNIARARRFERHRLALDPQAAVLRGLALLATRPAGRAGAIALALLRILALLASLTILAGLSILAGLTILAGLLAGRRLTVLIGLLAGLGLRQLVDRTR
jgi:hypothetical protein